MDNEQQYDFWDRLLLRTPFYSLDDYDLNKVSEVLQQPDFRNALWLASQDFYRSLEKKNFEWAALGQRERFTLQKYYNRMSFRPTPFGSFAAFTLASWSPERQVRLAKDGECILHLLPAQSRKISDLVAGCSEDCDLRSNPLLYRIGAEWRYMAAFADGNGKLRFNISAVDSNATNDFLVEACRKTTMRRSILIQLLAGRSGCTAGEAAGYIAFLTAEQVLLGPSGGLIEVSADGQQNPVREPGTGLPCGRSATQLAHIGLLSRFGNGKNEGLAGQLFYSGLERPVYRGGIDEQVKARLAAAVSLLQRIVPQAPNRDLQAFIREFKARFESQRVPLLKALDPDAGVGYARLHREQYAQEGLKGLRIPGPAERAELEWTAVHRLFLRLGLGNPAKGNVGPLVIREEDLLELPERAGALQPPPSMVVLYSEAPDYLILGAVGGASATALAGRFSVFTPEISALCREIAAAEAEANPGVIFAELHQLSHHHVDNINRRSRIYDHIIPLYVFPGTEEEKQLLPGDLLVSVVNDQVVLESITQGLRVVPRLPTAYNFRHNDLPVFRLLCDMQFQGLQTELSFNLERLFPGLGFYPRVIYQGCILSLARWYLSKSEISFLQESESPLGRLHLFRQERGIPRRISLGLSDQLLVFDLGNDREALFFLDCLKEEKTALLKEYLLPGDTVTAGKKRLAGEVMAFLKSKVAVYAPLPSRVDEEYVERTFLPGGEWLYVKLYCTPLSADKVLQDVIAPALDQAGARISCWFFIRYQDPEPHLRVRFRSSGNDATFILRKLKRLLSEGHHGALVRDYKHDTYNRELERYSAGLIGKVEALFCAGSTDVLQAIQNGSREPETAELKALALVWQMCRIFIADSDLLVGFFEIQQRRFLAEFNGDQQLLVDLDLKFRTVSRPMREILEGGRVAGEGGFSLGGMEAPLKVLAADSMSWTGYKRDGLLADLIHMQLNRFFISRQREHEMVVYHCCYKYALSLAAREKRA
ncbi:lantibiotic dehydratase [Mucilaginibacter sp. FT3.2]|uniref:lantibiotic dehydratase n=1 Tax=Mucilaginibacter sp. FT3.2 TaxID=2723090 RepID=UPI0016102181|nr:lantibiotic dehydratase [Mucilaginibacter sp. FT3.2]MBB6234198.1 thiopeptide-type bacteriocin biosynthesis protein [Mucilaginibacter sp. FT3.2]